MPAHRIPEGAFSLIELLCVLAIILIISVLGSSQLTTSSNKRGLNSCAANLQKVYLALSLYRNDNGSYPSATNAQSSEEPLSLLIPKCTTDTGIFLCPSSGDKPLPETEPFTKGRISYDYYMGRSTKDDPNDIILSDWQVDTLPKHIGNLVFSPDGGKPGNNHGKAGGNLITCGGAALFSPAKAAQDILFPSTVRLLAP